MIIVTSHDKTIGIDNEITIGKDIAIDITQGAAHSYVKLTIEKLKLLSSHLNDMISKYEGKTNSNSS